jgi:hypothetical protein
MNELAWAKLTSTLASVVVNFSQVTSLVPIMG